MEALAKEELAIVETMRKELEAKMAAMLREEKRSGSALGIEADRITSEGRLVSDEVINAIVGAWLQRQPGDGFVFDGYPRTIGQAGALDAMLASRAMPLDVAILLDADPATLLSTHYGSEALCLYSWH